MSLSNNGRAIVAMSISNLVFLCSDSTVKFLTEHLPPGEVMFARGGLVSVPIFMLLCFANHTLRQWRRLFEWPALLRALADGVLSVAYIKGLQAMPIADCVAIYQMVPVAIVAVGAFLYRERVGPKRWLAVAAGFGGTLMVVRPGFGAFNTAALLILFSVALAVVRDSITRNMPEDFPVPVISLGSSLALMVCAGAYGVTESWHRLSSHDLLLLTVTGILVSAGWLLLIGAVKGADLSVVAPFRYSTLVWAPISGYLLFGDVPDVWSLAGMATIALSGLYLLAEGRRAPAPVHLPARAGRSGIYATIDPDPEKSPADCAAA